MTAQEIEKAHLIYEAYGQGIFAQEGQTVPMLTLKETVVVEALILEAHAALDLLVNKSEYANLNGGGREVFNETIRDLKGCLDWIKFKPNRDNWVIRDSRKP